MFNREKIEGAMLKADKAFSIFIRKRDEPHGCITCGRHVPWKEADCGHFMSRECQSTRYNEQNCNLQCRECNSKDDKEAYALAIDRRYGEGTADKLRVLSKQFCKRNKIDFKEIERKYH